MNLKNNEKDKIVFSKYKTTLKITLTAIFAALSFAVLFLPKIYIPAAVGKPYIHFGNVIVVLVALLFGGPIAGVSSAIGMSVFDIIDGYGIWTIKTFILKFLFGIITGFIYLYYKKREKKSVIVHSYIFGSLFIIFGIVTMILSIINKGVINIVNKEVALSWPLYVFTIIFGIFLIMIPIISKNKNRDYQIAAFASTVGIVCNLVGEFIGKFIKSIVEGNGFLPSVAMSVSSLPATLINGVITIIIVLIVYPVLKRAVSEISLMKDNN